MSTSMGILCTALPPSSLIYLFLQYSTLQFKQSIMDIGAAAVDHV